MNAHRCHSPVKTAFVFCVSLGTLHMAVPGVIAAGTPRPKTTNAAPSTVEVPKSIFVVPSSPSEGRDPFFPLSRRLVADVPPSNGEVPKPPTVALTLKGVSGTESRRFALINDKTFALDEEREVSVGTTKYRVHCIEIREDSVIVDVNGTRLELRLRPGL